MKTYSRKSSSYLKKAFIASNFNEMCRLCLSEVDMVLTPIIQDSQTSYQEWIQYSVDVLVEEGDGLPPNICEVCLGMVEQTYLFKKKCKISDSKLREHLQLMDSNENRGTEVPFDVPDSSLDSNPKLNEENKEVESNQTMPEPNLVDPGGNKGMEPESTEGKNEFSENANEEVQKEDEETAKHHKSSSKGSAEKDAVKPIKNDNIVINEVKRYVWKNESTNEQDATVCEVVHYDIRKEGEDSNDESEGENSHIKRISTACILEGYRNSSKDSMQPDLQFLQNVELTEKNGGGDYGDKSEGRIREIRQLWDNDDEARGENLEDKEDEEMGEELEREEDQGLVVDVSWEPDGSQKIVKPQGGSRVLEVKFEENGVLKTHKVFTSDNSVQLIGAVPERREFKCFACSKHFATHGEMKSHLLSAHKEVSNSSLCEICFKSFTSANSLKRHMLVHTGIKPYACDICGRKFSQTSIMKRHRFTHGKKKPFECNFCQKSYTQKMNLITHLRIHGIKTETVSHRCKLCDKSFVHQSGLSRHLKQHKGVRFNCSACSKSFSDTSALARHIKSAHQ